MATKAITKKKAIVKKAAPKKKATPPKKTAVLVKNKHIISRDKGEQMKAAYMQEIQKIKATNPKLKIQFNNGREFDKSLFEELLKINGADRIRIYNALNEKNEHTFVITAVNKQNFNLFIPIPAATTKTAKSMVMAASTPTEDGVGNMGNQCTDPNYKPTT